jgi:hypothetical protein
MLINGFPRKFVGNINCLRKLNSAKLHILARVVKLIAEGKRGIAQLIDDPVLCLTEAGQAVDDPSGGKGELERFIVLVIHRPYMMHTFFLFSTSKL